VSSDPPSRECYSEWFREQAAWQASDEGREEQLMAEKISTGIAAAQNRLRPSADDSALSVSLAFR
jgi:hypothetical protein